MKTTSRIAAVTLCLFGCNGTVETMIADGGSSDLATTDMHVVMMDSSTTIDARIDAPADTGTVVTDTGVALGTPGCGMAHTGASTTESIMVGDLLREYALYVPTGYNPNVPARLLFGFHGAASNGPAFRGWVGAQLEPHAGSSAIFVYPTGTVIDGRTGWTTGARGIDAALVEAILAHLSANYCIDTARVFAFGFSWGGGMAHAMGCHRTGGISAVASGGGWWGFNGCEGPIPAWIFHASNDDINDYTMWGLPTRDHWVEANGCDATSTTPHDPSPCVSYDGCGENPVIWCTNATDGHAWPEWMSEGVWDFFASF